ncbi:hypothetical protein [Rhodovulum sp. PH10]|uniref:hypothetical protein n=1 Tax=Rhodovulum sp. PH10 TaxID=1187851 RepID=UPI003FCFACCB
MLVIMMMAVHVIMIVVVVVIMIMIVMMMMGALPRCAFRRRRSASTHRAHEKKPSACVTRHIRRALSRHDVCRSSTPRPPVPEASAIGFPDRPISCNYRTSPCYSA